MSRIVGGHWTSSSAATTTQRQNFDRVAQAFPPVLEALTALVRDDLGGLERRVEELGGPWTPGRIPQWESKR